MTKILSPGVDSSNLVKQYFINFGPQHPSAHGVLRLILELTGEVVLTSNPHIGLLHRGTEKLMENRTYVQNLPYLDRLDYVSMMAQEHTFSACIEKMLNIQVPKRAQYVRVLMLEITRILNHLMSLTTHAMDVGALTPFLWAFEEREKLMEVYEKVSGARLHANYIRPGGVSQDLSVGVVKLISEFISQFGSRIDEMEDLLTSNRIWKNRLSGVGVLSAQKALNWGFSGVMLRSAGYSWDLRKSLPYEVYNDIFFSIPAGVAGDCFDRYLMRVFEMRTSTSIIRNTLTALPLGSISSELKLAVKKKKLKTSMESLIQHFKYMTSGKRVGKGDCYMGT